MTRLNPKDLDAADPLARFRDAFVIEDPDLIYLDGNSLGRMPKRAAEVVRRIAEREWAHDLVRGWNEWIDLPVRLGAKIARLVGARPDEVIVTDSTSVNFFKLVIAALDARPDRRAIVTDDANFPSDLYLLQGAVRGAGGEHRLEILPTEPVSGASLEQILEALGDDGALLTLSHTLFKSGYVYDMRAVTHAAQHAGALTLWDLSHSVGALPVDLGAAGVDMAVGCTYKYLNGGPGAPAFLYVRRDLQNSLLSPVWGWFSHEDAFAFDQTYRPREGISRFLAGTPPILSMAAAEPGVDLMLEAGMENVRQKSVAMTEYLIQLWDEHLRPLGVILNSPLDPERRGSHISIGHPEALGIDLALIHEMKVVPDFRRPDNIRLGVCPLYTTFSEIAEAVERIRVVIAERRYERYRLDRPAVT